MKPNNPRGKPASAEKQLAQSLRIMGGPPPMPTTPAMSKTKMCTPKLGLNLGMDKFRSR